MGSIGAVSWLRLLTMLMSVSSAAMRATAVSMGSGTEWLPTLGVSWQVPQEPGSVAGLPSAALSLIPRTFSITMGAVLKTPWPRAMLACWALALPFHAV